MIVLDSIRASIQLAKNDILTKLFEKEMPTGMDPGDFSADVQGFFRNPLFGLGEIQTLEAAIVAEPELITVEVLREYVVLRKSTGNVELGEFFYNRFVSAGDGTDILLAFQQAHACLEVLLDQEEDGEELIASFLFTARKKYPELRTEMDAFIMGDEPEVIVSATEGVKAGDLVEEVSEQPSLVAPIPAIPSPPSIPASATTSMLLADKTFDDLLVYFSAVPKTATTREFTDNAKKFFADSRFAAEGQGIFRAAVMADPSKFFFEEVRGYVYRHRDEVLARHLISQLNTFPADQHTRVHKGFPLYWATAVALEAQAGLCDLYGDEAAREEMRNLCQQILATWNFADSRFVDFVYAVSKSGTIRQKNRVLRPPVFNRSAPAVVERPLLVMAPRPQVSQAAIEALIRTDENVRDVQVAPAYDAKKDETVYRPVNPSNRKGQSKRPPKNRPTRQLPAAAWATESDIRNLVVPATDSVEKLAAHFNGRRTTAVAS